LSCFIGYSNICHGSRFKALRADFVRRCWPFIPVWTHPEVYKSCGVKIKWDLAAIKGMAWGFQAPLGLIAGLPGAKFRYGFIVVIVLMAA